MEDKITIVCDNVNCTYEGEQVEKENLKQYLNKECPLCSENLLTQDDLDRTLVLLDTFEKLKSINIDYEKLSKETGKTIDELKHEVTLTFGTHQNIKLLGVK